jgi:hypothetical protein
MAILVLTGVQKAGAFRAYDCNTQSSTVEQYSLFKPEAWGTMQKVHAIERDLYGEIMQIKKERLVKVTRLCCVTVHVILKTSCSCKGF